MQSYDPQHIECGSTVQQYTANDKCDGLLNSIPAEKTPKITWGTGGVHLPYFWQIRGT